MFLLSLVLIEFYHEITGKSISEVTIDNIEEDSKIASFEQLPKRWVFSPFFSCFISTIRLSTMVTIMVIAIVLIGVEFIIIIFSFFLITQCLVSLLYLNKTLWIVSWVVTIRMIFFGKLIVFFLDFLLSCIVLKFKSIIEVMVVKADSV